MQYKLIDILICPECKNFPLQLSVNSKSGQIDNELDGKARAHFFKRFECEIFCAFRNKSIKDLMQNKSKKLSCNGCLKINIISGHLFCSKCRTKYLIINGIPRMIPKKFADL
ncbi:MAG: Trm112 family protein [Candidatus Marsarchaeota archaeon]|nr:Trm112 family protein [Candidatus Marsarchaeota archaeon]MCL5094999.1 Trm112 family protein [Candidatus Marsarchaeota archaeon]